MNKMGISGDELEAISEQLEMPVDETEDGEGFELGGAQAFPFLNNIFGGNIAQPEENSEGAGAPKPNKVTGKKGKPAREGKDRYRMG